MPYARETRTALRTLPDGRVAGVRRRDTGWLLECGEVRRAFVCALDALHAFGAWDGRVVVEARG